MEFTQGNKLTLKKYGDFAIKLNIFLYFSLPLALVWSTKRQVESSGNYGSHSSSKLMIFTLVNSPLQINENASIYHDPYWTFLGFLSLIFRLVCGKGGVGKFCFSLKSAGITPVQLIQKHNNLHTHKKCTYWSPIC